MDRDANYVAVGAFVLLIAALATGFVYWYAERGDRRATARYEIYFEGSVSGLTKGSPVRYLGVDVGKVARITLDPSHPKRVRVVADIDSTAPIDSRTRASLSLQGVTGLLFIDLEQNPHAGPPRPLAQGLHHPVIRSSPSDFDVLLGSLPELTTHAVELVDRLNQVFSDHNVATLRATIDNAQLASARLPATIGDVQQLVEEVRASTEAVDAAAVQLRTISQRSAPQIDATMKHVAEVAGNLADTTRRLDQLVAANGPALTRFTRDGLPQFDALVLESRDAARQMRDLSRSLREDPSRILYRPQPGGVKVPR